MTNIIFPKTDLVKCVFSFRSNNSDHVLLDNWDEYDHYKDAKRLKAYTYRVPEHLKYKLVVGDAVLVHCRTGYQVCVRSLRSMFLAVSMSSPLHLWCV